MATITVANILDKAEVVLQDTTNIRWPVAELIGWLNDGQREIVAFRPDAFNKTSVVTFAAGTKQSLPADGYQLINVVRNMGAGGATPGTAVRKVPQELLDAQVPGWHASTPSATPLHYMYDLRTPRIYYVYPPVTGTVQMEIVYSAAPTELTQVSDTIAIDDIYANVLLDYVLYRAYSKDFELTGNQARADYHYSKFETSLGKKAGADSASVQRDEVRG